MLGQKRLNKLEVIADLMITSDEKINKIAGIYMHEFFKTTEKKPKVCQGINIQVTVMPMKNDLKSAFVEAKEIENEIQKLLTVMSYNRWVTTISKWGGKEND
jgi:predicted Co/Zn/Cd cation transporter (cation efflux family)